MKLWKALLRSTATVGVGDGSGSVVLVAWPPRALPLLQATVATRPAMNRRASEKRLSGWPFGGGCVLQDNVPEDVAVSERLRSVTRLWAQKHL